MCIVTERAELLVPMSTTSPAAARAFVRASGCPAHNLKVLDDALLLITELIANSIRHGGEPIVLTIECDEHSLIVRVRDGSTALPQPRVATHSQENGRGLTLVDLLSDAWGVEPVRDDHGVGKAVWFRLRPSH